MPEFDTHSQTVLEFDKVLSLLRSVYPVPMGSESIEHMMPLGSAGQIKECLQEVEEFKEFFTSCEQIISAIKDTNPNPLIKRLRKGVLTLNPLELHQLSDVMWAACQLQDFGKGLLEIEFPISRPKLIGLPNLELAIMKIRNCVDSQGNVLNTASPKLAEIRVHLFKARQRVIRTLEALMQSDEFKDKIQESIVPMRNGRWVMLIKSQYKHLVKGIIHAQSASGATVFIEPLVTIEMQNLYHEYMFQEKQEIEQVLRNLTSLLRENLEALELLVNMLNDISLSVAKAKLSHIMDAAVPRLNEGGTLYLKKAYHPLLLMQQKEGFPDSEGFPQEVVPFDVYLDPNTRGILITGPNGGGKTVTLKAIGLLTMMVHYGLHIPAAPESDIPVVSGILCHIGDQQSIEDHMSTFTSHIKHIAHIVNKCSVSSMVIIDELGTGTDPEQGAALAMGLLEYFLKKECLFMVTSHLHPLKVYAARATSMENASMGYDPQTLRPTYTLIPRIPGKSNAFAVAEMFGLKDEILALSKHYIQTPYLEVDSLIEKLAAERKNFNSMKKDLESRIVKLDAKEKEYEEKMSTLHKEWDTAKEQALNEATRILDRARKIYNRLSQFSVSYPKTGVAGHMKAIHTDMVQLDRAIGEKLDALFKRDIHRPLEKGEEILIRGIRESGVLISIDEEKGTGTVILDGKKLTLPLSRLKPKMINKEVPHKKADVVLSIPHIESVPSSIDLRGHDVHAAIYILDKFINRAYLAGMDTVEIIHGVGSGALKKAVQEYLLEMPFVKSGKPKTDVLITGNKGTTVVHFSDHMLSTKSFPVPGAISQH